MIIKEFQYTGPTIFNSAGECLLINSNVYQLDIPWDTGRTRAGRWLFFIFDELNSKSKIYDIDVKYITSTRLYYLNMILND